MEFFKKFEKWELEHKIIAFVAIMIGTILLTRLVVFIHDPDPLLFHFEIHHFDYGILLLFVSCLLILFDNSKSPIYFTMAAIAFGLIIDELSFIRGNISFQAKSEAAVYNTTYFSVILISQAVVFAIVLINHFNKKRKK
jgi:hypothetical protein